MRDTVNFLTENVPSSYRNHFAATCLSIVDKIAYKFNPCTPSSNIKMFRSLLLLGSVALATCLSISSELPTNYEYYTSDGIKSGLSVDQPYFTLNNKNISIYSGAMHYFRVPRAYWSDRLRKIRAAGLNAVETYIAWNLHEPESGYYDFGDGGTTMEDFLHLEEFFETAKQEDLFVIVRPGPYICSEFEFGAYPSWLLREKNNIRVRTSDEVYTKYVSRWFNVLMPILAKHQFTKGGPIISLQVENEYAYFSGVDKEHLKQLRQLMLDNGIVELLTTTDNPSYKSSGTIPDLFFMTGDFGSNAASNFQQLQSVQPNKPVMVMEYYTGGSDVWGVTHNGHKDAAEFGQTFEDILAYPGSVNIYMFHGGTSFGFLSGGTSSNNDDYNSGFAGGKINNYDFDGCLKEDGDYGEKYYIVKDLVAKYVQIPTKLPPMPEIIPRVAYANVAIEKEIPLGILLATVPSVKSVNVIGMEDMDINNGSGQSYGYTIYRKRNLNLKAGSVLKIVGRVCDSVIVLVNGIRVSPILETVADLNQFGTWTTVNSTITLTDVDLEDATVDLFVENWGRVYFGLFKQYKGLWQGGVEINDEPIYSWIIYALEFKKSWTNSLKYWTDVSSTSSIDEPRLFKGNLEINDTPRDTYVYMEEWTNGIVIVNGFVLGRYRRMGPQQTLYLPAPFLKKGSNDIVIFEHFRPKGYVSFVADPIYAVH
ncbi:beta-galactosidase-1-like protein 2 [Cylas formicarius]|uniref:beta-galactosidase-1-like protein 2 n=1 Tax=Cylas formicarius TaxID=197179 RepID=UPI0029586882|nr:beta-galactosidase-1-like protein 2 [Cylas formicarius]